MRPLPSNIRDRTIGSKFAAVIITLGVFWAPASGAAAEVVLRLDPHMVKGPDSCGECHKASVAAWKQSRHATSFKTLPRSKKAKEIAKKMGIRRIKAKSSCLTCHFTSAVPKKRIKAIAGITCESCHGAASKWIKLHSDYGGKGVKKDSETPQHKTKRYADSEAAGMIRPRRLYSVANNCYQCHTVPNEKLVNVGGHPAGSAFELVAWSQGEVRHNVWYSKSNDEASADRKRLMYVVGKALDLEHALRGLAIATGPGAYAEAMTKRALSAKADIAKIAGTAKTAEIGSIMAAAGVGLKLGNAGPLNAAAEKIQAAARKISDGRNGAALAAVDAMMPGADKYKGTVPK